MSNFIYHIMSFEQVIKLWEIKDERLEEISKEKLDFENRLEDWLEADISILSPYLLVIGKQVPTDFGGYVDLLCLEEDGDLVVVELKRDRTPREVTAQTIDYASWVNDLTGEQIVRIANDYLKDKGPLEQEYERQFSSSLPDSLNDNHKMLVVASEIDSSSQRIINYLSEVHGVGINAVTFNYFKSTDREYIARTFLIEPSRVDAQQRRKGLSKRLKDLTVEELTQIADEKGVREVFIFLAEGLKPLFDVRGTTRTSIAFQGNIDGRRRVIFSLIPKDSDKNKGVRWQLYFKRFVAYFGLDEEKIIELLPTTKEPYEYYQNAPDDLKGYTGYLNQNEAENFVREMKAMVSD